MNTDSFSSLAGWIFNPCACWIFVLLSLAGSYCNATLRLKSSYVIWLPSNIYLMIYNIRIGESAQGLLFTAYLFFNLIGLRNTFRGKAG